MLWCSFISFALEIPLLGIYLKEILRNVDQKSHPRRFTETFFIIKGKNNHQMCSRTMYWVRKQAAHWLCGVMPVVQEAAVPAKALERVLLKDWITNDFFSSCFFNICILNTIYFASPEKKIHVVFKNLVSASHDKYPPHRDLQNLLCRPT